MQEVCSRFEFACHFESHLARPAPFYVRMQTTISDEHSIDTMLHSTRIIYSTYSFKRKCKASPGGSVKKWWFVIKRNELDAELLEELLKISIQTALLHTVHEWLQHLEEVQKVPLFSLILRKHSTLSLTCSCYPS